MDYDDDEYLITIQMEDGIWYDLCLKEEENNSYYVAEEVPQDRLEYYQNLPDKSDLCQLCEFDVIDTNYREYNMDMDDPCYLRYCLTCLDYKGKLIGRDKRRAVWLHHQ